MPPLLDRPLDGLVGRRTADQLAKQALADKDPATRTAEDDRMEAEGAGQELKGKGQQFAGKVKGALGDDI